MNPSSNESDLRSLVLTACQTDDARALSELAATGAPFDRIGPLGESACLIAARAGSSRAIQAMAEAGIDTFAEHLAMRFSLETATHSSSLSYPNPGDPRLAGQTALHAAVKSGHLSCAQILCELGANLEARNIHGLRAIDMAALHGAPNLLSMLFQAGSEIEALDSSGMTALMNCSRLGDAGAECAAILIEFDANPKAIDFSGQTALDHARTSRGSRIQIILEQAGSRKGPAHSKRARACIALCETLDAFRSSASRA